MSDDPMADKMREVLARECPCSCIDAYKGRGRADPQCTYHDVEPLLEDFATVARKHIEELFTNWSKT